MSSRKGRRLSAVAALGIGTLLCAAGPAQAVLASPQADAYVVSASAIAGLLAVAPTPHSNFPGPPSGTQTVLGIAAGPFASNSLLTATTAGSVPAGTSSASATVDSLTATLPLPLLTTAIAVTGVNATCTAPAAPGAATGDGFISGGTVTVNSINVATLAANASPNTTVGIAGVGTLTLNEKSTDANGVLTVNSVHLVLLPTLGGGDVVIGHAQCGGAAPTQEVPMVNPQVGFSFGAMALAGAAVYMRRRNGADTDGS